MDECSRCSVDAGVSRIIEREDKQAGAFGRMTLQSNKCSFGQMGVCCQLCANGPCRMTEKSPRGVCGADKDTVVARNFLRSVAAGAACYLHVAENSAEQLRSGKVDINEIAVKRLATRLGIQTDGLGNGDISKVVAEIVLDDLHAPRSKRVRCIRSLAPEKEVRKWEALGILPGGAKAEVFDALVKTSTNLSSNVTDMLLHCLRLGIVTGYYGLVLTNALNDVILGDPEIAVASCGLGTINLKTLNIAITGHQQVVSVHGVNRLLANGLEKAAVEAGAEGVCIVGLTCVGQDMQSRCGAESTRFSGHVGDNFTAEATLLIGCIDLLVSDFNCTLPGLDIIAQEQGIPEVCVDDVAMLPNAIKLSAEEDGAEAIEMIVKGAVNHFAGRSDKELSLPKDVTKTLTGITENSLVAFLGGTLEPVLNLIKEGKIRGLAGVVGCSNLIDGHGFLTERLTRELIKRDMLVLSAGCTSGVLSNCGLMNLDAAQQAGPNLKTICRELGIPPVLNFGPCLGIGRIEQVVQAAAGAFGIEMCQLPVVVSAPEWLEEQALADGLFALALGLPLHLGTAPAITGSEVVIDVLTNKMKELTGGIVYIEPDAVKAAEWMADMIEKKRKGLGLN